MVLSEVVNRPTSVSGFAAGNRADKSPPAIASAVSSTASSGLSPIATIHLDAIAIINNAIRPNVKNRNLNLLRVWSTSASELATITLPNPVGSSCASALTSGVLPLPSIVNGRYLYFSTSISFKPVIEKFSPANSPPIRPIKLPSLSNKVIDIVVGTPPNGGKILKGESSSAASGGVMPVASNRVSEAFEILTNPLSTWDIR